MNEKSKTHQTFVHVQKSFECGKLTPLLLLPGTDILLYFLNVLQGIKQLKTEVLILMSALPSAEQKIKRIPSV